MRDFQFDLVARAIIGHDRIMSAADMLGLKQQLVRLSNKEREEAAAFLYRLKQDTPAWRKEMARRMAEMDAGKKFSLKNRAP